MVSRYAFYPGCTLHSTGIEFGVSSELVCQALGLEMVEIPDWNCCGASSAHKPDRAKAVQPLLLRPKALLPVAMELAARPLGRHRIVPRIIREVRCLSGLPRGCCEGASASARVSVREGADVGGLGQDLTAQLRGWAAVWLPGGIQGDQSHCCRGESLGEGRERPGQGVVE